jgi:nucleoside-diphosphate-sugar epimerase
MQRMVQQIMRNHKLTVLVTGSEGFIGRHLCAALQQHEYVHKIIKFDINSRLRQDVCDKYCVAKTFANDDINLVYHLAASTQVEFRRRWAVEQNYVNNIGTQYILDYAPKYCRVVLSSSVHCEDQISSVYAASKLGAEALVKAYTNMGLIEGVILRLTSVVGKGATHGIVKDFVERLKENSTALEIIGVEPGSLRPYVHIDDVVDKLIYHGVVQDEREHWVRRLSCYNPISASEVADTVMNVMGIHKDKIWLGEKSIWLGDKTRIDGHNDYVDMRYQRSEEAIHRAVKDMVNDDI